MNAELATTYGGREALFNLKDFF